MSEKMYNVYHFQGNTYQVVGCDEYLETVYFQGSLSDCESYIRLSEGGYL